MPKSRPTPTTEMVAAISAAIMRWHDATSRFDEAVGDRLDLSATERRCLACLVQGARPAKDVATATGLTRAAVTTLLDRLEERHFVQRAPDQTDRRQVLVSMTAKARRLTEQYYAQIAIEGAELLGRFTPVELAAIRKFIEAAAALQEEHVDRLDRKS